MEQETEDWAGEHFLSSPRPSLRLSNWLPPSGKVFLEPHRDGDEEEARLELSGQAAGSAAALTAAINTCKRLRSGPGRSSHLHTGSCCREPPQRGDLVSSTQPARPGTGSAQCELQAFWSFMVHLSASLQSSRSDLV